MFASLLVLMNSFLFIFSLGLSYARFLPGILVTSASCPHFFRMTVTQAVRFSFSGIQLPVLNSQVKRNHSNSTRDSRHQYENQEGHPLAAQLKSQTRGRRSFVIRKEMWTFLLEKGFKVPVMAQLLIASTRTVGEARWPPNTDSTECGSNVINLAMLCSHPTKQGKLQCVYEFYNSKCQHWFREINME